MQDYCIYKLACTGAPLSVVVASAIDAHMVKNVPRAVFVTLTTRHKMGLANVDAAAYHATHLTHTMR